MVVARHGTGARAALGALASQVHPVFMLPPVAVAWFGALLAPRVAFGVAALHAGAVFCAVYTAHVKDGYVDFHVRGEDDDHPLTRTGCRTALAVAGVGFAACALALLVLAGPVVAVLDLVGWLVGYLHAPQLDTDPVTTTVGYPFGVSLALVAGFYAQTGRVGVVPLALAAVFLVALAGVKIVDDTQDFEWDRDAGKRTVAVVFGLERARDVGFALLAAALCAVLALAAVGVLPTGAVLAVFAYGAVAGIARRADRETATMLLVRGAYVFLAVLAAVVRYRPLSAPPPADILALGPYTYLATEAVFGALALALLVRARALRSAAWTVATVYPLAYLWDWYSLRVGVFSIHARTGVALLGLPVEEHLFVVVVASFVVAVHELRTRRAGVRRRSGG